MVHIINHPGMNIRPVEAVGLRRQSCPIIANPKLMCHVSMTKIAWLLLCRETIAVYFEMHMKSINTVCGKNTELLNVKVGATYSYDCALKG
jgi:hypothetical protein